MSESEKDTKVEQDGEAATLVRTPGASGPGPAVSEALPESMAPGCTLVGRYTVLEQLGQGGMGVVLAAYDSRLDRRVALKVLRRGVQGSAGEAARLEREAQAMAQLNHPNVMAVYDTGALEDGSLFIAMEYVAGQTLRRWCARAERSWREVLGAYLAAGRGLAAAHAAGLIHRDFKPDNVLVGEDGRVRVTDFGLARSRQALDSTEPSPLPEARLPGSVPSGSWSSSALTLAGTLMGTPGYMAREQLLGRPADARSDLFAFCASLHEALYGQLPFSGDTLGELARAQEEERVVSPPSASEVPAWLARVVRQGLRADPSRRPASMEVLLAELEDDPEVKRKARLRTVAVSTLVVGLAGLALWGLVRPQTRAPGCEQVSRQLAGIWDASVKERVRQSLLGTDLPYAQDTFARVASVLDGYAGSWVAQRTEVCEAVREQPAPASGLAVRREYCLERRRSQLHALTELLSRGPDPELLPKVVQVARSLPPLEDCANPKALAEAVPLPEEPAVRARVGVLQEALDRPEALLEAGKYSEALARADELLREAEQVGYAPLHARALFLVGRSRERTGDYPGAEQVTREAILMASRAREPVLTARLWGLLFFQTGYFQARYQEAAALELAMESAVEMADDDEIRAQVLNNQAVVLSVQGRAEDALRRYEQALALREKALGPAHPVVASVLNNLGNTLDELGRYEEARGMHERALAIREEALGPRHPDLAYTLGNLGNTLLSLNHFEEARGMHERALALREETLGPDHPLVASSLENLGDTLMKLERHEEARALFARAVTLHEKARGADHPRTLGALGSLASALEKLERTEEASVILRRTLPLLEAALGPGHVDLSEPLHVLGNVRVAQGRYEEAREHYERSLTLLEAARGREHPDLTDTLLQLGRLELARKRPARAVPLLERAHGLAEERHRAPVALALAQALWDSGQERSRAVALATGARQHWERLGHPKAAEASRWLAAHAAP